MQHELKHILCIDDEPDVLSVAQLCLETVGGYHVSTASSGTEAIETTKILHPDVILLDMMMPDMDGQATLQQLRKNASLQDVPIIFMTARVREVEIKEYLSLGADDVLSKPFDPMMLASQVHAIWEKFHAARRQ
jgi:CheY-like chemotaxis protein